MPLDVPSFDDLPPVEGMPQGCAWGVFDKDGQKDVYGTLNLLTPDVVVAAAREVTEGVSVSLNWPIGAIAKPAAGRCPLHHKVMAFTPEKHGFVGLDDEVQYNTQSSSQWDSLSHYAHQPTGLGYNGTPTTIEAAAAARENNDNKDPAHARTLAQPRRPSWSRCAHRLRPLRKTAQH